MERHRVLSTLLIYGFVALFALGLATSARSASSVEFTTDWVAGVSVDVVTADLGDPNLRLTPVIARWGIGTSESFRSILRRTRPAAAINGTFFDVRTLRPTGDIVIDGRLLVKGDLGTAIAISADNKVTFLPSRRSDLYNWTDYTHVIGAGPSLILRGRTVVEPWDEGFKSGVHYSQRRRAAIGLTSHNKLVLVTTRGKIYLGRLARVMRCLGCTDAAVLDGGSSTGLYWKGKVIVNPARGMTNCLLVYDDPSSYENHRDTFCPPAKRTSALPALVVKR